MSTPRWIPCLCIGKDCDGECGDSNCPAFLRMQQNEITVLPPSAEAQELAVNVLRSQAIRPTAKEVRICQDAITAAEKRGLALAVRLIKELSKQQCGYGIARERAVLREAVKIIVKKIKGS